MASAARACDREESSLFEWNYDTICQLIDCFEKFPCVYNTKLKEYRNRDKRDKALREIDEMLGTTSTCKQHDDSLLASRND